MTKGSSIVSLSAATAVVVAVGVALFRNDNFAAQYSVTHAAMQQQFSLLEQHFFSDAATAYWSTWQDAAKNVFTDSYTAVASISVFLYLTIRPIALLTYSVVRWVLHIFYEYVLVRGIFSPSSSAQMKLLFRKAIQFQLSLNSKQLAIEGAIIATAGAAYWFLKFLKRRKYLRRIKLYGRKKKRAIAKVRSYLLVYASASLASCCCRSLLLSVAFRFEYYCHF